MWCRSVLLLLVLGTVSSLAQGKVGQSCHTKSGVKGTCRQIAHCSKALELIHNGIIPDICSFQGNSAIVCCEEKVGNIIVTVSSQKQKPYGGNLSVFRPSENIHEIAFTEDPRKRTTKNSEVLIGSPSEGYKPENSNHKDNNDNDNIQGSLVNIQDISQRTKLEIEADYTNGMHRKKKISEQMCEEYSKRATTTIIALPLLPRPDPVPITVQKCDFEKLPLIVGGEKALAGEFPHMAAIGFQDGGDFAWNCGGSLISDNYVLTAAHCTHSSKGEPVVVRLGEHNLRSDNDGAQPVNYAIKEITRHPDYNPPAKYNDIALLKLDRKVFFTKFIQPACLYTNDTFTVNKTVATGWGSIDYAEKPSDVLLKVALDIINNNDCNQLWHTSPSQSTLANGIAPSMMCAGVLTGGKDTCQGDSGGPIQITSKKNQCIYYVVGVTSFGKYCAARNTPGVYTRVSTYVSWIENIVWPQN